MKLICISAIISSLYRYRSLIVTNFFLIVPWAFPHRSGLKIQIQIITFNKLPISQNILVEIKNRFFCIRISITFWVIRIFDRYNLKEIIFFDFSSDSLVVKFFNFLQKTPLFSNFFSNQIFFRTIIQFLFQFFFKLMVTIYFIYLKIFYWI